jgi:glycine dehydrogenase
MLDYLGFSNLEALLEATIPESIRTKQNLNLPNALTENATLVALRKLMEKNRVTRSFIGMGYNPSLTPSVIQRGVLENPGWYTQYTPYQAEIAQGRLEVLLYFQTMICDLTGMEVANASLLDEGTAAAEAMALAYSLKGSDQKSRLAIANPCHPQTEAVLQTRAEAVGIQLCKMAPETWTSDQGIFAVLIQYPDTHGAISDLEKSIKTAHEMGAIVIVASDLLPLTLLKPPGELGADIVVGTSQPFGIPLGYGGPHAGFFATKDKYKRKMPGRVVGVSKDARGKPAFRLALQTREQHIRREKATSNICTAQALLANMAALYAIYHGPKGLIRIASEIHDKTVRLADRLIQASIQLDHEQFFDTLSIKVSGDQKRGMIERASNLGINFRYQDIDGIGITLNETTTERDLEDIIEAVTAGQGTAISDPPATTLAADSKRIPAALCRESTFLNDPVFERYHSETELLRFIKRLESKDLSLTTSMIPLGSCTMKLNAAMEMQALSWPEVATLHPFCPEGQAAGYHEMFTQLENWLANITGFDAVSLQPNAGSQGEYAGLLAIKGFLESTKGAGRNVCLIPRSAHGTNPASAVMAGFKVIPVDCDSHGNIDLDHLGKLASEHQAVLGALMITYPSTHGVFEEEVIQMTQIIHDFGGQVYLDGANLNAQVGLCTPGELGADVCHLNLHKTFCIPHGGGGPGVGPIAVRSHLSPFLPGHPADSTLAKNRIGPVSASPFGSASILTISWAYIAAMGAPGLTIATGVAILNANYIAQRLEPSFPILYRGKTGRVAHECIIDLRDYRIVTVEDVAKRLMDYGFHAPTISWPVAGTMMIEPTESESRDEMDRFCDAMISIHKEIIMVEDGRVSAEDNLLKNAPHTADMVTASEWKHPYTRNEAAFPLDSLYNHKFWPAVGRIDNVYGDRNPICTCQGMEQFESE